MSKFDKVNTFHLKGKQSKKLSICIYTDNYVACLMCLVVLLFLYYMETDNFLPLFQQEQHRNS